MADPKYLSFKGSSPKECANFVSAVRKHALAKEKHLDNQWIAFFASSCFVGDAFFWFETLDEETQNDWRRLRPALVARFGTGGPPSTVTTSAAATSVSALPLTIPTPAAAAPAATPSSLVRKGRLKVLDLGGSFIGYLKNKVDAEHIYNSVTGTCNKALVVSIASSPVGNVFGLQIEGGDALSVYGRAPNANRWMDHPYGHANCCSCLGVVSKYGLSCAVEQKVWSISDDAELVVEYLKPDGGTEILRPYRYRGKFAWLKPYRSDISSYRALKVVFEDIN